MAEAPIMKRIKSLWPKIIAWDNLYLAYRSARRSKQSRCEVIDFSFNLEYELRNLQQALVNQTYRPAPYRQYKIYDRKPRTISVAPFRDRVLQHALMRNVEPLIDKRMIADSYACRKNKGVHKGVDRLQQYMQRYPYLLKLDIASYFPSIDHRILKEKLKRIIADNNVLKLFGIIIDSAPIPEKSIPPFEHDDLLDFMRPRGLPIGNLTSQFLGNLYLNDVDHFIKDELGIKAYVRYVDDLVILGNNKEQLRHVLEKLREQLNAERLHIHKTKCWLQPCSSGVEFLGYRLWSTRRQLRNDNGYQFRRRLKKMAKRYKAGELNFAEIKPLIASWLGHAKHGETHELCKTIFAEVPFVKG